MRTRVIALFVAAGLMSGAGLVAQEPDTGPVMRVFLKDGQALPSFGESAQTADRIVFTLVVGDPGGTPQLQLVSLPLGLVDMDRTVRYGEAVRAARYATTRGETDYAAMTRDISQALDELTKTTDPIERLRIAEKARKRLLDWSKDSYGYRAADVLELTNLFDQVIAELRAAAGESRFSVDLSMGPPATVHESLMTTPTVRESMQLALSAATATDDAVGREAILGAVVKASTDAPGVEDVRDEAARRLAAELTTDRAYKSLSTDVLARADAAAAQGDVRAILALKQTVAARDTALGSSRPEDVESLLKSVDARLDGARSRRLTLDHYAMMRPQMLAYERRTRPALSALDGLTPIFEAIRDMTGPGFEWLLRADGHLKTLLPLMQAIEVPADLADVHATLLSAITMAAQACERRKLAVAANDMPLAREASTAAAGALMLAAQGRQELLARLYPPKN
jgi:hypothetical protein